MVAKVAILDIGKEPFTNLESLCHCDASHQVLAQCHLQFVGSCRLKTFKMAPMVAILDIEMILI